MDKDKVIKVDKQFIFESGSINTIINGGTFHGDVYTGPKYKESPNEVTFPPALGHDKIVELKSFLVNESFVDSQTDSNSFFYYFGEVNYKPNKLLPIKWIVEGPAKQLLRELIEGVFYPMIERKEITKSRLEEIVPKVFIDKNGEPISLAKNKKVLSLESDKIANFLATFRN